MKRHINLMVDREICEVFQADKSEINPLNESSAYADRCHDSGCNSVITLFTEICRRAIFIGGATLETLGECV